MGSGRNGSIFGGVVKNRRIMKDKKTGKQETKSKPIETSRVKDGSKLQVFREWSIKNPKEMLAILEAIGNTKC